MNHTNSDIAVINRGNVDSYESTKNIKSKIPTTINVKAKL